jgi:hypothetical protein
VAPQCVTKRNLRCLGEGSGDGHGQFRAGGGECRDRCPNQTRGHTRPMREFHGATHEQFSANASADNPESQSDIRLHGSWRIPPGVEHSVMLPTDLTTVSSADTAYSRSLIHASFTSGMIAYGKAKARGMQA